MHQSCQPRQLVLDLLRDIEEHRSIIGVSNHTLAVAWARPRGKDHIDD